MLDSGHEVCSRKLKSKPHSMFSFFEKKGKEIWCLLGNAIWFLLGKHATCWSGHALDVDAIWLKGKTKKPKILSKNKWKEPLQTVICLVNNVTQRFVRSKNVKVSFLYLSVKLWLLHSPWKYLTAMQKLTTSENKWQKILTKQQQERENILFTFLFLTRIDCFQCVVFMNHQESVSEEFWRPDVPLLLTK